MKALEPKSVVVKCKSSNGAGANRNEKRKTFSRSDVEFHPLTIKKRGVYVENKDNNMQVNNFFENKDVEFKRKPPPRPRPGQKRFLTSVLNILSKSTTGTQYPDYNDPTTAQKKYGTKRRDKTRKQDDPTLLNLDINGDIKNNKTKYKSKILNSKDYASNDKFVILQAKKEIVHTPSNFSELSKSFTFNESKNPLRELFENNIYSGVAESTLAKEISEGRVLDKDPTTLVADAPPKDDKKIYNFFVDLLETTFDVYNVKTEAMINNNKDSETILEIDEAVAKKLNTKNDVVKDKEHELNFDIKQDKPCGLSCLISKSKVSQSEYKPEKPVKIKKTPKNKSINAKSSIYSKPIVIKPSSALMRRKPLSKAAKKKDLLNTIKEELKMDFYTHEEPQNLYQALRNMAKYKRKCQENKTIHDADDGSKNIDKECLFSRGIFPKRLKTRKISQATAKAEKKVSDCRNRLKSARPAAADVSHHSLEVYEYEYETNEKLLGRGKRQYTYIMSDGSDVEIDSNSIFGLSDSSINMKEFYYLLQD